MVVDISFLLCLGFEVYPNGFEHSVQGGLFDIPLKTKIWNIEPHPRDKTDLSEMLLKVGNRIINGWLLNLCFGYFCFLPSACPLCPVLCVCHSDKVTAPAFLSLAGDGSDDYFDLSIPCPLLLLALLLRPC